MNCRHCGTSLTHTFLDLGFAPPSNSYLSSEDLIRPETHIPLRLKVCDCCWLVQTEDYTSADSLFAEDYAYFSSTSSGWLAHARHYSCHIQEQLSLDNESFVIEVASNDGYLLRNFVDAGIPCLGIEPTASTAAAAEHLGIPVLREFFSHELGNRLSQLGLQADLIIGNNVYAHVPNINDFTSGLKAALKPGGTITLEFPHLMKLIEQTQFDTVYHEHFSYLSLHTVAKIFTSVGLRVFDVNEISTHGGSLRVFGCHTDDVRIVSNNVERILVRETSVGLQNLNVYDSFQSRADTVKDNLVAFLIEQKYSGRHVAAYGAAAKGNTLLNYAGIKPDLLPYVCDAALSKQGKYLPGSHIPIFHPTRLSEDQPDLVLILPWNIANEVVQQNAFIRDWGGRFVTAVPNLEII